MNFFDEMTRITKVYLAGMKAGQGLRDDYERVERIFNAFKNCRDCPLVSYHAARFDEPGGYECDCLHGSLPASACPDLEDA